MNLRQKKIAVLDLTHGGIPISVRLAELGAEVTAVDVYGTVAPSNLAELEKLHGIKTQGKNSPPETANFDFLTAPVHLDPAHPWLAGAREAQIPVHSHHRIVGEILTKDPRLSGIKTIEITGSKAKTSTASVLSDIISRKSETVLHTSRGLESWNGGVPVPIHKGLSITPGSILTALDRTFEAGIRPGYFIFEISIGGTGSADLGLLTTLTPDYGIANESGLASDAKLQLIRDAKPGSVLVLNAGAKKALACAEEAGTKEKAETKIITFSDPFLPGSENEADLVLKSEGNTVSIRKGELFFSANLKAGYNVNAYMTAFSAASAAALELGVESDIIKSVLEEFEGLSGRMQEKELGLHGEKRKTEITVPLIDNSNSGLDIRSAEKALEYALLKRKDERREKLILILGEEAAQVCEGLPPETVRTFVAEHGNKFEKILLVGERMRRVKAENVLYADSLPEGLSKAADLAGENDLVISCVKCFR